MNEEIKKRAVKYGYSPVIFYTPSNLQDHIDKYCRDAHEMTVAWGIINYMSLEIARRDLALEANGITLEEEA